MGLDSYYVYILQSQKDNRYYIGHTSNLEERLEQHNSALVKSTRYRVPFKIVHSEKFDTRTEAMKREYEIKRIKGGLKFKELLKINTTN
jgi:putative endonuclease